MQTSGFRSRSLLCLLLSVLVIPISQTNGHRHIPGDGVCPVRVSSVSQLAEELNCGHCESCNQVVLRQVGSFAEHDDHPEVEVVRDFRVTGSPGVVWDVGDRNGTITIGSGFTLELFGFGVTGVMKSVEEGSFLRPAAFALGEGSLLNLTEVVLLTSPSMVDECIRIAKDSLPASAYEVKKHHTASTGELYLSILDWQSDLVAASNVTISNLAMPRIATVDGVMRFIVSHSKGLLGAFDLLPEEPQIRSIDIVNDLVLDPEDWPRDRFVITRNVSILNGIRGMPVLDFSLINSGVRLARDVVVELNGLEVINLARGVQKPEIAGQLWFFNFDRRRTGVVVRNSKLVVSCGELEDLQYAVALLLDPLQTLLPATPNLTLSADDWELGNSGETYLQVKFARSLGIEFRNVNVTCKPSKGTLLDADPVPAARVNQTKPQPPAMTPTRSVVRRRFVDVGAPNNATAVDNESGKTSFILFKVLLALLVPIFLILGLAFFWKLQKMRNQTQTEDMTVSKTGSKDLKSSKTYSSNAKHGKNSRSHSRSKATGDDHSSRKRSEGAYRSGGSQGLRRSGSETLPFDVKKRSELAEFIPDILAVAEDIDDKQLVLLECMGQGSYGSVHRGKWRELDVAVKTIVFRGQHDNQRWQQSAIREVAITSGLAHQNVVCTYSYDIKRLHQGGAEVDFTGETSCSDQSGLRISDACVDWKLYIIQEFCEAGSLKRALELHSLAERRSGGPDLEKVLDIAIGVARGIHHIHTKNIIHGDLKPSNVLLKRTDTTRSKFIAKIADFGLSLKMKGSQTHVSNVQSGTPFYMAPEVIEQGSSSKAADVYAFGVIMWEMYVSQFPGPQADLEFPKMPWVCPVLFGIVIVCCTQSDPVLRPTFHDIIGVLCQIWQQLRNGTIVTPYTQSRWRRRPRFPNAPCQFAEAEIEPIPIHTDREIEMGHFRGGREINFEDVDGAKAAFREVVATLPGTLQHVDFEDVYNDHVS